MRLIYCDKCEAETNHSCYGTEKYHCIPCVKSFHENVKVVFKIDGKEIAPMPSDFFRTNHECEDDDAEKKP